MKYLLDTSVLVDHLRGRTILEKRFLKEGSLISVITLAELFYGVLKTKGKTKAIVDLKDKLSLLDIVAVNLTERIIEIFAQDKRKLEEKGERIEDFDLFISATAKAENLVLVTRNERHLGRIKGLKIYSFKNN